MSRSFNANVSPCFILIRFLSRHFIAYLQRVMQSSEIEEMNERNIGMWIALRCFADEQVGGLHFASVCLPTAVDFAEASAPNDAMHAEVVHCQCNVQL